MTKITIEEVEHLASLSSLRLEKQELVDLTKDIENIIDYVGSLADLDTDNVEPTYQTTGLSNVSRGDVVKESEVPTEELLELSQGGVKNNQIRAPKVI